MSEDIVLDITKIARRWALDFRTDMTRVNSQELRLAVFEYPINVWVTAWERGPLERDELKIVNHETWPELLDIPALVKATKRALNAGAYDAARALAIRSALVLLPLPDSPEDGLGPDGSETAKRREEPLTPSPSLADKGLVEAARALCAKLIAAKPYLDGVCVIAHLHGASYSGPTFNEEQETLSVLVAKIGRAHV